MYCPKCGATIEGVKFCRQCGTNVSLVPQIVSGALTEESQTALLASRSYSMPQQKPLNDYGLSKGIQTAFTGLGFLLVSLAVAQFAPAGRLWWFWLLIPAFTMLGSGVAGIVRARLAERMAMQQENRQNAQSVPAFSQPVMAPPSQTFSTGRLPGSQPGELNVPGSIIEDTTRQLDPSRQKVERPG